MKKVHIIHGSFRQATLIDSIGDWGVTEDADGRVSITHLVTGCSAVNYAEKNSDKLRALLTELAEIPRFGINDKDVIKNRVRPILVKHGYMKKVVGSDEPNS